MNKIKALTWLVLIVGTIVSLSSLAVSQNREKFGISAKAGGVNVIVGRVMATRVGQAPQLLTNKDDVATGQLVTTGALSHAEILLNPGSYFRVGENSEFEFVDGSLDNLRLKLLRGSAIVEVTGTDTLDLRIGLTTPQAFLTITRAGVYRIDVQRETTDFLVQKGRAYIADDKRNVIKKGYKATFSNGTSIQTKIVKDKDEFEVWSKQRAELLAKANEHLSPRALDAYLGGFRNGLTWPGTWGLWTFSSRAGCYTFLPFFYGWSTPYGGYYGSYYFWRGLDAYGGPGQLPPVIVNNQTGATPGGSAGGGGPTPGPTINPNPNPIGPQPAPSQLPRDPDSGLPMVHKSRDP